MQLTRKLLAVSSLFVASAASADLSSLPAGKYNVDPQHGYILFSYSHFGLSEPQVGFNTFEASIELDPESPSDSAVAVSIDVSSVDSRVDVFDGHLRSADWFDVESHPTATFTATSISTTENGHTITGDLTVKGITKEITLMAKVSTVATHPIQRVPAIGVSATGEIKRSDFDLGAYAPAVSDEVTLTIEAEFLLK